LKFPEIPVAVKKITTMAGYYQNPRQFSNEKEAKKQGSNEIRIFNTVGQFSLFFYFFISFFFQNWYNFHDNNNLCKRRYICIAQNAETTISKMQIYANPAASQYQPRPKCRIANQKQANLQFGRLC
jgi:hypothetical protein